MSDTSDSTPRSSYGRISHVLRWYWVRRPAEILRVYHAYAAAFGSMFSLIYLLKTFIAPWKSIKDAYPSKGLNLAAILETLTLNVTARVVGMVVRTGAMIAGLMLQIFLFVISIVYLFVWIVFPFLILTIILFLFRQSL